MSPTYDFNYFVTVISVIALIAWPLKITAMVEIRFVELLVKKFTYLIHYLFIFSFLPSYSVLFQLLFIHSLKKVFLFARMDAWRDNRFG